MISDSIDLYKIPEILIARIALETDVDALLISAIIVKESGGNRWAQQYQPGYPYLHKVTEFARSIGCSYATELHMQRTSWGMMQIMGGTARFLGFRGWFGQLFDPETNIRFGARLLSNLKKTYGLETDVISAYNQGQPFRNQQGRYKNQEYVDDILTIKRRLRR